MKTLNPNNLTPIQLTPEMTEIVISDDYKIEIEKGDYILIRMGQDARNPASKFAHPKVSAKVKVIHEFKHYLPNGGKRWTAKAGLDFYFIVHKKHIQVIPEKGYSYVPVIVNGAELLLNVGGGGGKVWTDYIGSTVSTSVGHPKSDMKKVAECSEGHEVSYKLLDEHELSYWNELANSKNHKRNFALHFKAGKTLKVCLKESYSFPFNGSQTAEVENIDFGKKRVNGRYESSNRIKGILVRNCRIKPSQVDWIKTAELNGALS